MNWIRVDVDIHDDPRIHQMAETCRVSLDEMVGAVVGVLCKMPQHARDGRIDTVGDATLEQWGHWRGKRSLFAQAFRQELVEDGTVRAWEKHNGAALREADKQRDRMRAYRKSLVNETPENGAHRHKPSGVTPSTDNTIGADHVADMVSATSSARLGARTTLTERNGTTPTSEPDGSAAVPAATVRATAPGTARPVPTATIAKQELTGTALQEAELRAAGLPHEVAALEFLAGGGFRPAIIGELHAIASGMHVVRGDHAPYRVADIADVMRACSEFAAKGRNAWDTSYFRGVVRRILDRPPEPPDAQAREDARLARQVTLFQPSAATAIKQHADLSPDERAAADSRRAEAMAHFRAEFRRNNPAPAEK